MKVMYDTSREHDIGPTTSTSDLGRHTSSDSSNHTIRTAATTTTTRKTVRTREWAISQLYHWQFHQRRTTPIFDSYNTTSIHIFTFVLCFSIHRHHSLSSFLIKCTSGGYCNSSNIRAEMTLILHNLHWCRKGSSTTTTMMRRKKWIRMIRRCGWRR